MRKIFKRLHFWLAIPSGLLITLMCLTGAVMVFQTQIQEALNHDRYFHAHSFERPMELDSLVDAVNAQLVGDTVRAISVAADRSRNVVATLTSGARTYAYVNPISAQVVDIHNVRSGFFHNMMTLHRWLMLPDRAVGKVIMGVSTIALIFIIVTGLLRVFRARGGNLRKISLRFRWRGANGFRKTLDLHKVLGIYCALLVLVMALTGLMWSFDWYRGAATKILGVRVEQTRPPRSDSSAGAQRKADGAHFWQNALDLTVAQRPDYRSVTITKSGEISLLPLEASHGRAVDKYRFSRRDNSVTLLSEYGQINDRSYMMSQNYAIHVGSWGGLFTQILWFVAALVGAALPVTGYVLYFKRRSTRKRSVSRL